MSEDNVVVSNVAESVEPKKKRVYTKRQPVVDISAVEKIPVTSMPFVVPPEVPNPAVLALQDDIITLIKQRSDVLQHISECTGAVNAAQSRLEGAQQHLRNLEHEVQYRMSVIAQMKGEPQKINIGGLAPQVDRVDFYHQSGTSYTPIQIPPPVELPNGYGVSIPAGVGSIPAAPRERGPRTESAIGFRDAETQARAAI